MQYNVKQNKKCRLLRSKRQVGKKKLNLQELTSAHLFGNTRRPFLRSASLAVNSFSNKGIRLDFDLEYD